jgi:RNA polymerase sigma factor (sigma-70 family)
VQDAVQEAERARELDPLGLIVNAHLCNVLIFARRYDEALAQCKANIDLDPNSPDPLWMLGNVYAAKGMAIRGWLYRIATNACLDRLRQRKPQLSLEGSSCEEDRDQIKTLCSPSPSPLEITERKETSACVQRCLDFLPDKYRVVILLREAHSLTAAEIADLLGVTVSTIKIRLHRARRRLQQVMERGCAVARDTQGVPTCKPKL